MTRTKKTVIFFQIVLILGIIFSFFCPWDETEKALTEAEQRSHIADDWSNFRFSCVDEVDANIKIKTTEQQDNALSACTIKADAHFKIQRYADASPPCAPETSSEGSGHFLCNCAQASTDSSCHAVLGTASSATARSPL